MNKLQVVVPIGIGAPGTPVQKFFEEGINSLLSQTEPVDICIAADENIPDRIKDFIIEKNLTVKWFETNTFFKKGSIWIKLFEGWKESNTEYVAFMHYDDIWDKDKAKIQLEHIERENLNGSWSEAYYMDENSNVVSGDCASFMEFNMSTVGRRTAAFAHSIIVKRTELDNCGILECADGWATIFEDVWTVYMGKIGNMKKSVGSKFFWRNHSMNITNTGNLPYVDEMRIDANYTLDQAWSDSDKIRPLVENAYRVAISKISQ